jgi:hypothetical protein
MTIRGLDGTRLTLVAVIRRATGRLEADCPTVTAEVIRIKANDKVQRERADRAERSTIVRGNSNLFILGERSFSPKRARP